ncbi:MAG: hypothetical protein ACREPR_09435 [Brasilonema sp.]
MNDKNDDIFQDTGIGETAPDLEVSLPVKDLYITISRTAEEDGYTTRLRFSRKVRRYYVIGLLQEALAMCMQTNAEFIWTETEDEE